MFIIRRYEMNHPVVGIADSWEAFEAAKLAEMKAIHEKRDPDFPWDKNWEKHYKEIIKEQFYAEKPTNYWKKG